MKRLLASALFSLLIASSALAQSPQQATETKPSVALPSLDQILDKYVQAIGGQAALERITSRRAKGSFEMAEQTGTIELEAKAPNKSLSVVTLPGFGVLKEGGNGAVAWMLHPQAGLREKKSGEPTLIGLDNEFYKPLRLKSLYPKMMLKGREKVGEREAYLIAAVPAEGGPEKWYFETQSGLLIRVDLEVAAPGMTFTLETWLEDYREVDGVRIPFTVRKVAPDGTLRIRLAEVKHNVPIEDAKFDKPVLSNPQK